MSIGSSILQMLGNEDPRQALLRSIAQASAPGGPGVQAPAAAAGAGGTTAPPPGSASGVQPTGYESPPDLSALYERLEKYTTREANMNRGFGLIGAAIAKPENRANVLNAFTAGNDGSGSNLQGLGQTIMDINKMEIARQQRAAGLAALPAIARQYGLSMEAVTQLFNEGKLQDVIAEAEKPRRELRELGDGRIGLIDLNDNTQIGTFGDPKKNIQQISDPERGTVAVDLNNPTAPGTVLAGPDNRTDDTKEYDKYVLQTENAGKIAMSFEDWQLKNKRAGANQTNVNMPGEPNEFEKALQKNYGEEYVNLMNEGKNARQMLDQYDVLEMALDSGVRTGAFGEAELAARKVGQIIGVVGADDPKVVGGELIQKVGNRMALLMRNPESGMGMPGSVSDKDIEFLKQSQIGLSTSGEGNKTSLEIFRRIEKRKIQLAQLAEDYVAEHKTLQGFNRVATKYNEENPMFADMQVKPQSREERLKAIRERNKR